MKAWYAVHTKPRREAEAERQLGNQGFATYLPRIRLRKRRKERWVELIEPLFPRYLFIQVDPVVQSIAPVRSTLGVSGLVRFGGEPCALPASIIAELQRAEDPGAGCHLESSPLFRRGDPVELTDGPFAGLTAVFEESIGEKRALILLDCLGRQNRVAVGVDQMVRAASR